MPQRVTLYDYQRPHVERLKTILGRGPAAFDFSPPGTGKTMTSIELAEWFSRMHGFDHNRGVVVTLLGIINANWNPTTEGLDYKCLSTAGYERLRGTYTSGCRNPLLTREKDNFQVTPEFAEQIEEGVMVIVDEYQRLKNAKTAQARALFAITKAIIESKSQKSRLLFLSATPMCNKQEVESTFRLAGILQSENIIEYHNKSGRYLQTGIEEIRDYCSALNPQLTAKLCPAIVTNKNLSDVIFKLFTKVVMEHIVSKMPKPPIKVKIRSYNKFMNLSTMGEKTLQEAADLLTKKLAICKATGNTNGIYEALNTFFMISERTKLPLLVRELRELLNSDSKCKVLGVLRLHDTIKQAYEELIAEFPGQIAILNGEVPAELRPKIIAKYMENNSELRGVIMHPDIGGVGISLDDRSGTNGGTDGEYLRYTRGFADHHIISEIQYITRTYRITATSDVDVAFLFAKNVKHEHQLIQSACEKLEILSELTDPEYLALVFPKEIVIEP